MTFEDYLEETLRAADRVLEECARRERAIAGTLRRNKLEIADLKERGGNLKRRLAGAGGREMDATSRDEAHHEVDAIAAELAKAETVLKNSEAAIRAMYQGIQNSKRDAALAKRWVERVRSDDSFRGRLHRAIMATCFYRSYGTARNNTGEPTDVSIAAVMAMQGGLSDTLLMWPSAGQAWSTRDADEIFRLEGGEHHAVRFVWDFRRTDRALIAAKVRQGDAAFLAELVGGPGSTGQAMATTPEAHARWRFRAIALKHLYDSDVERVDMTALLDWLHEQFSNDERSLLGLDWPNPSKPVLREGVDETANRQRRGQHAADMRRYWAEAATRRTMRDRAGKLLRRFFEQVGLMQKP